MIGVAFKVLWADISSPVKMIGAVLVLLTIGCCGLNEFVAFGARKECGYAAVNANVETKYVRNNPMSYDCYVKLNDQWVPIDKWRGIEK